MTAGLTLIIDGVARDFIPLPVARAALDLPEDFGVALFEPKDYTGLGRIDGAGEALHALRDAVLAADRALADADPLARCDALTAVFERELRRINPAIGLREPEIGFAVSGFSDVLRAWAYARIQAAALRSDPLPFAAVYGRWLNDSVRVSATVHRFAYRRQVWKVQIVTHAYGRFGVIMEDEAGRSIAISDPRLACPAEGFMMRLLEAICTSDDGGAPGRSPERAGSPERAE
jgi:hypothetical protein